MNNNPIERTAINKSKTNIGREFESYCVLIAHRTYYEQLKDMYAGKIKNMSYNEIVELEKNLNARAKENVISTINTDEDRFRGTDCIYDNNYRIDFTCHFDKKLQKDYVPFIADTGIKATDTENFYIGIKHGHHKDKAFEEPVAIIGVNMTGRDYRYSENIIEYNLEKNMDKLLKHAVDGLEAYMNGGEGFDTILKPNKQYQEPKNLPKNRPNYHKLNKMLEQSIKENNPDYKTENAYDDISKP